MFESTIARLVEADGNGHHFIKSQRAFTVSFLSRQITSDGSSLARTFGKNHQCRRKVV
jgi:hypothetical protein